MENTVIWEGGPDGAYTTYVGCTDPATEAVADEVGPTRLVVGPGSGSVSGLPENCQWPEVFGLERNRLNFLCVESCDSADRPHLGSTATTYVFR